MKQIKANTYKGTRILLGDDKRRKIDVVCSLLRISEYTEIIVPIIQYAETFDNKVGDNQKMMFTFQDRAGRHLCLAPEYTLVVRNLVSSTFAHTKDVRLFYIAECFRGENPQYGRWRQFTQIGVEVLNPTKDYTEDHIKLARKLIAFFMTPSNEQWFKYALGRLSCNIGAKRGLDYYTNSTFEIHSDLLGTASQICGGGAYENGQGFALGLDRLLLLTEMINDFTVFKNAGDEQENTILHPGETSEKGSVL